MMCTLGIKKTGILLLSMTVLVSSLILSNQAYAGSPPVSCESACANQANLQEFICLNIDQKLPAECAIEKQDFLNNCLIGCQSVGGEFLGVDSTALLLTGAQMNAAWMIPVIVSAIGIGIVIARKF